MDHHVEVYSYNHYSLDDLADKALEDYLEPCHLKAHSFSFKLPGLSALVPTLDVDYNLVPSFAFDIHSFSYWLLPMLEHKYLRNFVPIEF